MQMSNSISTHLSKQESLELEACEAVIERGLETFYEVGKALLQIRDERLYRASHGTFEAYCRERWRMSRSYAHRTIEAAQITDNLLPMGNAPTSERQLRPLVGLEPEQQRNIWQQVLDEGHPTARRIAQLVEALEEAGEPEPMTTEQKKDYKRIRSEMASNSEHNSLLFRFIDAIETFSSPPLPLTQAAREVFDIDPDLRAQALEASINLSDFLEAMP